MNHLLLKRFWSSCPCDVEENAQVTPEAFLFRLPKILCASETRMPSVQPWRFASAIRHLTPTQQSNGNRRYSRRRRTAGSERTMPTTILLHSFTLNNAIRRVKLDSTTPSTGEVQ